MRSPSSLVLATLAIASGILLSAPTSSAPAAGVIVPAPGSPDPKQMVLTAADLGRAARVTMQGYYKDDDFPSVISFAREFEDGRAGRTELPYVDSEAEIGTSTATTASFLRFVKRFFGSKAGRKSLQEGFAEDFPTGGLVTDARIGRPRALGVGPGSFDLPLSFKVFGLRTESHVAAFRVERVLGVLVAVGVPGEHVSRSVLARLARVMAGRMSAQLAPHNTALPAISGSPAVGQELVASAGSWSGSPSSFAYQWQRCDSAGGSCSAIAGAAGRSYEVVEADVGATIRVAVTARSAVGATTAVSIPTSVVPAPGAPTNTSPPTISGTPQSGQTLTATTGAWEGSPSSFAFQWQRCNAGGASCVDIPAATSGTYALTVSDVGSTVRVVVTARNAAGDASASSLPTSTIT